MPYRPLSARSICLYVIACLCCYAFPVFAEPVRIGAIFSLTGIASRSNEPALAGTQLAVREINEQGGVLGENIELLMFDNKSTPIGSHLAAEKAAEAGVTAIIGSAWSSHSIAVARVADKHHIPMISPISTIPSLTAIGDYIFRVCYDDEFQGSALARFAFTVIKARRALIFVNITSDFSMNISRIFSKTFVSLGGTIVGEIEYKSGQDDYQPAIEKARGEEADIVFLSGYDESGLIAARLQAAGQKAVPIGTDGWDVPSFYAMGGNTIRRGYFINHWMPRDTSPLSQAFVAKFADRSDIPALTALSYDAVKILAAAIVRAGSPDREKIHASLHSLKGFKGVTGDISFNALGNAAKQACIAEIRNGVTDYLQCIPSDEQ